MLTWGNSLDGTDGFRGSFFASPSTGAEVGNFTPGSGMGAFAFAVAVAAGTDAGLSSAVRGGDGLLAGLSTPSLAVVSKAGLQGGIGDNFAPGCAIPPVANISGV